MLGDDADSYLQLFAQLLTSVPYRLAWAVVYIEARK